LLLQAVSSFSLSLTLSFFLSFSPGFFLGVEKCESCLVYEIFEKEIANMPPAIGGQRHRLKEITDYLINYNKPELDPIIIQRSNRPTKWQIRKDALFGNFSILKYLFPKSKSIVTPEEAIQANPTEMAKTLQYLYKFDAKKASLTSNQNEKNVINDQEKNEKFTSIMEHIKSREEAGKVGTDGEDGGISSKTEKETEGKGEDGSYILDGPWGGDDENSAIVPVHLAMDTTIDGSITTHSLAPNESIGTVEKRVSKRGFGKSKNNNASNFNLLKTTTGSLTSLMSSLSLNGSKSGLPPLPPASQEGKESESTEVKRHGFGSNQKQKMEIGDILPTGHRIKPGTQLSVVEQLNEKHGIGNNSARGSLQEFSSSGGDGSGQEGKRKRKRKKVSS
jgi:hypothetical protein